MHTSWRTVAAGVLALAAAAPASAQIKPAWVGDGDAGVHRMDIRDGRGNTTTRYFYYGLSPSEQAALRELELNQNQLAFAEQLLALRSQFLATEQLIEQQRQLALLGKFGVVLTPRTGGGYPSTATTPAPPPYGSFEETGGIWGGPAGFGVLAGAPAFSPGDDGVLRAVWAKQFAELASPEYVAQAYRQYANARTAVAAVEKQPGKSPIRVAGIDPDAGLPRQATVTLKNGQKREGTLIADTPEWVILGTPTGELRVRTADVAEMDIKVRK